MSKKKNFDTDYLIDDITMMEPQENLELIRGADKNA